LDDFGARIEIRPREMLRHLSIQSGLSKSSASRVTTLVKILPYNMKTVKIDISAVLGSRKYVLQVIRRIGNKLIC
jgi:hypothetical protein